MKKFWETLHDSEIPIGKAKFSLISSKSQILEQ